MAPLENPQSNDDTLKLPAATEAGAPGDTETVRLDQGVSAAPQEETMTQRMACLRLQTVFQHVGSCSKALFHLSGPDPESTDVAAVKALACEKLEAVEVIRRMIGENRKQLLRVIDRALKEHDPGGVNPVLFADRNRGRYGVMEPVGRGGYGVIKKVRLDTPLRIGTDSIHECIIKILVPTGGTEEEEERHSRRFQMESDALRALKGVVPDVFGTGTTAEGMPYFLMEHIHGLSVERLMHCMKKSVDSDATHALQWPMRWFYLFLASTAKSLEEIHHPAGSTQTVATDADAEAVHDSGQLQQGVPIGFVHRDVKPSNILLDTNGRIRPIDLGIARSLDADRTVFTQTGAIIGTPNYMAPELQHGVKDFTSTQSDVYALGCMAFEMLTGMRAFPGNDSNKVLLSHSERFPNFDLIRNPRARALVMRMLRKNQERRPSMQEVAEECMAIFLRRASPEDQEQFGNFLSRSHEDRKIPLPHDMDIDALNEFEGGDTDATQKDRTHLTETCLSFGEGEPLPNPDENTYDLYIKDENEDPVKKGRLIRMREWMNQHRNIKALSTVGAGVLAVCSTKFALDAYTEQKTRVIVHAGSSEDPGNTIAPLKTESQSILHAPASPDEPHAPLWVAYGENGHMKEIVLLGHRIDGKDVYQFTGNSSQDAKSKGAPPNCHFGLCYLSDEDVATLLQVKKSDLPESLRKVNTVVRENEDKSKISKKVDGLFVSVYENDGAVVTILELLGVIIRQKDGTVQCFTSYPLPDTEEVDMHRYASVPDAMRAGYKAAAPFLDSFPIDMEEANSAEPFSSLPTSTHTVRRFVILTMGTQLHAAEEAKKSLRENPKEIVPIAPQKNPAPAPQKNALPQSNMYPRPAKKLSHSPQLLAAQTQRIPGIQRARSGLLSASRKGRRLS
ncbi:hypothetical protein COU76_01780 [Candidatus Peregrinibacteria bacterium CG10_big_fil_rev_8_21_14_0_10_49_10]|nr:MAG: hypothetical protein COU76_01780 [Candidatus Peregrinibacteria bacterium CG10_big_fil_rev_8_21_14_0_10_49_10]